MSSPLKVMVINYFERGNFWPDGITKGFLDELRYSQISFTSRTVYFKELGRSKERVLEEVKQFKPTIVLLTDDAIADILMPDLMKNKIATFFTGVNREPEEISWLKKEWSDYQTGVVQHYRSSESIRILQKFKPIKNIGILAGPSDAAINLANFIKKDILATYPEISVTIRSEGNYTKWKNAVSDLNQSEDALWPLLPFHVRHDNGELVHWDDAGEYMRSTISIPTVGVGNLDGPIDRLFSIGINPLDLGKQTAIQAFFHLKGKPVKQIPVERFRFHNIQFKLQELKRLNIKLPQELYGFAKIVG